jgi:hypothetical protein
MSTEHWWNDADREELQYWEADLSHCHLVHHKAHTEWLGIEPISPRSDERRLTA